MIEFIADPTISDLENVVSYVNRNLSLNAFPKIATNEPLTEDHAALWHQKYLLGEQVYSIAVSHGGIVGVSHVDVFHGRRRHSGKLALTVDVDHRGKGIGDALLKEMIQQCKNRGVFLIRAEPTEDNAEMIHLLLKNGFTVEGKCQNGFLDDESGLIDLIEYTLTVELI